MTNETNPEAANVPPDRAAERLAEIDTLIAGGEMTKTEAAARLAKAARWACSPHAPRVETMTLLAAALADYDRAVPDDGWRPIEEMPRVFEPGAKTYWTKDEYEFLVPACGHYPYGPSRYIGRLEADMWLVRCADDPIVFSELHCPPTHYRPPLPPPRAPEGGDE